MRTSTAQKGISIVEAVISIAIFAVISTVAYQTYITVNRMGESSDKRDRAVRLAEEGIEAVRSIRDTNFTNVSTTTVRGLTIGASSTWQLAGTNDVTNGYIRTLTLTKVDADTTTVASKVDWLDRSATSTVTLSTTFTNWRKVVLQSLGLSFDTTFVNTSLLSGNRLLTGIYLTTNATSSIVTITSIKASWTSSSRKLQEIHSPASVTVFGSGSVSSAATTTLTTPIVLTPSSSQLIEFYYSGAVNGNTFTLVFGLSDGSNKSVVISSPPIGL
ncbi:MAG: hypothetical protein V4576_01055 [Patescibacteria group bacterium]